MTELASLAPKNYDCQLSSGTSCDYSALSNKLYSSKGSCSLHRATFLLYRIARWRQLEIYLNKKMAMQQYVTQMTVPKKLVLGQAMQMTSWISNDSKRKRDKKSIANL
jgi:hypothetical protein